MELGEQSRSHGECGLPVSWAISCPGLSLSSRPRRRGAAVVSLVRLRARERGVGGRCRASKSHTLRSLGSPPFGPLCSYTALLRAARAPGPSSPALGDQWKRWLIPAFPLTHPHRTFFTLRCPSLGSCRHICSGSLKHLRFSCSVVVRRDSVEGAAKS